MKPTHFLYLFGVFSIIVSCSSGYTDNSAKPSGYSISGKINGIHSGTVKLKRYNQDDGSTTTIDSTVFSRDTFRLKGVMEYPQMLSLVVDPGNWSFPFFVENSIITIQADTIDAEHYDWTGYGGSKGSELKKYTVAGSVSNEEYLRYKNDKGLRKYDAVFASLGKRIDSLMQIKNVDAEYKTREQADSLRLVLQNDQMNYISDFQSRKPSSVAGAYMLYEVYKFIYRKPVERIDSLLNRFEGDARKSGYYLSINSRQQKIKALYPGKIAPDFTLLKKDSSIFTLSSLRGNYTLVDFWASWCYPCREAIPHWKSVYRKYHSKGLELLSVSNDSQWSDWFKAMETEEMPWHQVCDEFPLSNMPARVASVYMASSIPLYVLLDKEGKILVYSASEEDIDNKLKEIFGS